MYMYNKCINSEQVNRYAFQFLRSYFIFIFCSQKFNAKLDFHICTDKEVCIYLRSPDRKGSTLYLTILPKTFVISKVLQESFV